MKLMSKSERADFLTAAGYEPGDSYFKYLLGHNDYIATDGGEVICVPKPGIDSTIWYDDEAEDPAKACGLKAVFLVHNMEYQWRGLGLADWASNREEPARTAAYVGGFRERPALVPNGEAYSVTVHAGAWAHPQQIARELSDTETAELMEIVEGLRKAYEKRLSTYWKRYGHKVRTSGYWRWR